MPAILRVLLGLVAGYAAGAAAGLGLVEVFSSNVHDKSQEAVMTAAFVTGPAGAVLGAVIALMRKRRLM